MRNKFKVGDYFYHKFFSSYFIIGKVTDIGKRHECIMIHYKIVRSSDERCFRSDELTKVPPIEFNDVNCEFQMGSPMYKQAKKLCDSSDSSILAVML